MSRAADKASLLVASLAIAALLVGCGKAAPPTPPTAQPARLAIPEPVDEVRIDFENWKDSDWSPAGGKWSVREVEDAPSGTHVLERTVLDASSPAFFWDGDELADVEVSVNFRFLGAQPTETGFVLRQAEGSYYAYRVDSEGVTRLCGVVKGTIADSGFSVSRDRISAGTWHTLTAIAIGDQFECRMDSRLTSRNGDGWLKKGKVGIWWLGGNAVQVDDFIIRTHAAPLEVFEGLDWKGVSAGARVRFFARANGEKCPCGSGRTLPRCGKAGCVKALERGREVLELCEGE